ncbi:fimbrial protein [Pseudomonas palleroniana]
MGWRYLYVLSGWVFCLNATAYDLLLGVEGVIADNGCVVSADSQNMTVTMGNVALKQFYADDVAFGQRQFVIRLERCSALASGVKVTFEGAANVDNAELLQLTQESNVATGLAIEILDNNNERIPINIKMSAPLEINVAAGASKDLMFYAQYRSVGVVSAGSANSTANFILEYQ